MAVGHYSLCSKFHCLLKLRLPLTCSARRCSFPYLFCYKLRNRYIEVPIFCSLSCS